MAVHELQLSSGKL